MTQNKTNKSSPPTEDLLTSSEVARLLGVVVASVKRWSDAGLLACVRTAGGHRRFAREEVLRFQRDGATEAEPPPESDPAHWLRVLREQHDSHAIVGALLQERARLGAWWRAAEVLGASLAFMGRQWSLGDFSIIDEHLISERLARGLARCTEAMPLNPDADRALLASADGDEHTLGLSLVELCLREAGLITIWAGRKTPTSELIRSLQLGQVEYVALSASAFSDEAVLTRQALQLSAACQQEGGTLILGGAGHWPEPLPHTHRVKSFRELFGLLQG